MGVPNSVYRKVLCTLWVNKKTFKTDFGKLALYDVTLSNSENIQIFFKNAILLLSSYAST